MFKYVRCSGQKTARTKGNQNSASNRIVASPFVGAYDGQYRMIHSSGKRAGCLIQVFSRLSHSAALTLALMPFADGDAGRITRPRFTLDQGSEATPAYRPK